jgi:hypothetical protein
MRLKDYGRNQKKRKEFILKPGLMMVGVDVSEAKHNACMGVQKGVICRKLQFASTQDIDLSYLKCHWKKG